MTRHNLLEKIHINNNAILSLKIRKNVRECVYGRDLHDVAQVYDILGHKTILL